MLGAGETVVGQTDRFEPSPFGSAMYAPKRAGQAGAALGSVTQSTPRVANG